MRGIKELDIKTGELLCEWSSLAHISPDGKSIRLSAPFTMTRSSLNKTEAVIPLNPGQAGSGSGSSGAWDYFPINSADKDANGDYLISVRNTCTVYKINRTTGKTIWRLSGRQSDFELGLAPNAVFCFQHHAQFLAQSENEEVISLFDNDGHGSSLHMHSPFSQGKIVRVDTGH